MRDSSQSIITAPLAGRGATFAPTQWSVVLAAGRRNEGGHAALERLCRAYWQPIYAHLRRLGHPEHDAQDFAQEFFSRLLAGDSLVGAAPEKGRFRSWLLGALKHFLMNARRDAAALKRGGGREIFSLDAADPVLRQEWEPRDDCSPDLLYDRRWAGTVLDRVMVRLRHEYEAAGQIDRYEALKPYLPGDSVALSYTDTAARLGISESAARSAIYKIRQRYGDVLRAEISDTVGTAEEVEDEIRCLLTALRG